MPIIYITRLRGDNKLLFARWTLTEAAQMVTTLITKSQGAATEEDFEHIPLWLPEKEEPHAKNQ